MSVVKVIAHLKQRKAAKIQVLPWDEWMSWIEYIFKQYVRPLESSFYNKNDVDIPLLGAIETLQKKLYNL